jgi:stage V sporulation protein G
MADTASVTVHVLNVAPTPNKGKLLALASAEVVIEGVSLTLHGVQVLQRPDPVTGADGIGVMAPRYRSADGAWRASIELPPELNRPLSQAILDVCCEMGITQRRGRLNVAR